jgi:hypothetical protein
MRSLVLLLLASILALVATEKREGDGHDELTIHPPDPGGLLSDRHSYKSPREGRSHVLEVQERQCNTDQDCVASVSRNFVPRLRTSSLTTSAMLLDRQPKRLCPRIRWPTRRRSSRRYVRFYYNSRANYKPSSNRYPLASLRSTNILKPEEQPRHLKLTNPIRQLQLGR